MHAAWLAGAIQLVVAGGCGVVPSLAVAPVPFRPPRLCFAPGCATPLWQVSGPHIIEHHVLSPPFGGCRPIPPAVTSHHPAAPSTIFCFAFHPDTQHSAPAGH